MNQCLWCGNHYVQGQEGICRECWEKNQFSMKEPEEAKDDKG